MAEKCVTVVEIGSSKLSCMIAEQGINKTFNIKAKASVDYAGFFEGDFIERAYLDDAVMTLFSQINIVIVFINNYIVIITNITH